MGKHEKKSQLNKEKGEGTRLIGTTIPDQGDVLQQALTLVALQDQPHVRLVLLDTAVQLTPLVFVPSVTTLDLMIRPVFSVLPGHTANLRVSNHLSLSLSLSLFLSLPLSLSHRLS